MRIGIDVGGTKIEGIALNSAGVELRRLRVPTPRGEYQGTIDAIVGIVHDLETATHRVGSVGVGIPGTVVASTGLVKNANSIWLNGQPFQRDLSHALDREVRCANDANCFAVSEAVDGAARGHGTVFGVIVGTGCGGGVVLNGRVHSGINGLAGEWGHMPLPWATPNEYPGPACYCGRHGCLETWISGTGLQQDFARVTGRALHGKEIVAASDTGDPEALAALHGLVDRMARGLAVVVNILDPDVIVLGGGLSNIDWLYPRLTAEISRHTFGGRVETPVLKAQHGDSSGVRGAAWLWEPQVAELAD